jgi:hypothetical protein
MSRGGNSARGLASGYAAGRNRVDEIIADRRRVDFVRLLHKRDFDYVVKMTASEQVFVRRILLETDRQTVFNLHPGDRNIIDSLRRKYESKLP